MLNLIFHHIFFFFFVVTERYIDSMNFESLYENKIQKFILLVILTTFAVSLLSLDNICYV
jgi:hypothetical protein